MQRETEVEDHQLIDGDGNGVARVAGGGLVVMLTTKPIQ